MKLKEFTENVHTLLLHGVYYDDNGFEAPHQVKQISEKTVLVELFDPKDTFMITVERRDDSDRS